MNRPTRARRQLLLGLLLAFTAFPVRAATVEVRGSVLSPSRTPLPGVRVLLLPDLSRFALAEAHLRGEAGPRPVATTETDDRGSFRLEAPGVGLYRVAVEGTGYAPVTTRALPLLGLTELAPVAPPTAGEIRVRVLDAAGHPLPGARVLAGSADEKRVGRELARGWEPAPRLAFTGPDGRASLPRLAGESLEVLAFAPGALEMHGEAAEGETVLRLPAGKGALRLEIVGDDSRPVAGAAVLTGRGDWAATATGADGRAELPGPARPPLRLSVLAPDGRRFAGEAAVSGETLRITIPSPKPFASIVRSAETAQPLAGALVWLPEEPGVWTLTDREGRCRLAATLTPRAVHAAAAGHLSRQVRTTATGLAAGQLPTLALQPAVALAGKAMDPGGAPAAGIAVAAVPAEAAPGLLYAAAWSVTGRDGGFELRGLVPGAPYRVQVAQAGLAAEPQAASAPAAGKPAPPLRLVISPSAGARGRALDAAGRPLSGVEVLLRPAAPPNPSNLQTIEPTRPEEKAFLAETDARGIFTLRDLPAPVVDLIARKPGFAPAVVRGLKTLPGKAPAPLGDVVLRPGARLTGRVVDRSGQPLQGAAVHSVQRLDDLDRLAGRLAERPPAAVSRADGSFALADLPPGAPVHLLVVAEGFAPAGARGVLPPTAEPVVVRLEPASPVRGRIVDEAGQGIAGAGVYLEWAATLPGAPRVRTGARATRSAVADRRGEFQLRNVPWGTARVSSAAEGFVAAEPLEVQVPQLPGTPLTLILRRGGTLEGRISTRRGEPVEGARVAAHEALAVSDGDGRYRLSGLPLGRLEVEVMHPHYPRRVESVEVTGGADVLDLQFEAGRRLTGLVLSARRQPVAGALVSLETLAPGRGQRAYRAWSQADGSFELRPVADGDYRLAAEAAGFTGQRLPAPLAVRGEDREGLEITLERGGAIVGRVSGLPPEELAWVEVTADGDDPEAEGVTARVDAQGRYALSPLAPGSWRVRARHPQRQRAVEARAVLRGQGEEAVRDLRFGGGLALAGRVDADGEPVAGALVSVRGKSRELEQSAVTDHQGEFRLDDLEADTYHLGVTHRESLSVHNEEIALPADRQIEIHLRLGKVSGRVLDGKTGAPVERALLALRPLAGPEFLVAASAEEGGGFLLPRVPEGSYRLSASAEGYRALERQVDVAAGSETGGLEIALEPVTGLDLVVRLAGGQIPGQIHLRATEARTGATLAETRVVGAGGQVRLATLPAGAWELWIGAPGGAAVRRSVQVPGEPLQIVLPPAGRLAVRVPDLEESNWLGAVSVQSSDRQAFTAPALGGALASSWPLVGGNAAIENLPAGVWTAVAQAPDGRVWTGQVMTDGRDAAVTLQ